MSPHAPSDERSSGWTEDRSARLHTEREADDFLSCAFLAVDRRCPDAADETLAQGKTQAECPAELGVPTHTVRRAVARMRLVTSAESARAALGILQGVSRERQNLRRAPIRSNRRITVLGTIWTST